MVLLIHRDKGGIKMKYFTWLITIGMIIFNIFTVMGITWELLCATNSDILAVLVIGSTVILFDLVLIGAYHYYKEELK